VSTSFRCVAIFAGQDSAVGGDGEFPELARIGRLGYVNRCPSARLRDVLRCPYKAPILIKHILCKMPEAKTEQSVLSQVLLACAPKTQPI
jgi:hypothetical protein